MNKHNYLMALAMNSNVATLRLSNVDIPVKITEVESEGGAYSSSMTTFKCLVVNDDQIKNSDPRTIGEQLNRRFKEAMNSMYGANPKPSHTYVKPYQIDRVIFNAPATIVFWADGTKTVVKCQDGDTYSKETGLAVAIAKKVFGNKGNFNEVFKQFIPEYGKSED